MLVGGDAAPADLIERAEAAGVRAVVSYGMTETCGGCVYDGRPLEGIEIALQTSDVADDAENGMSAEQRLSVPGAGRIDISGPVIARGYRNRPRDRAFARRHAPNVSHLRPWGPARRRAHRARAARRRPHHRRRQGGSRGGRTMHFPAAPGVAEVVVVGVPHAEWGSAVTAVVTREGDAVPDLDTLRALAAAALGPAAAPRHLLVVPELPDDRARQARPGGDPRARRARPHGGMVTPRARFTRTELERFRGATDRRRAAGPAATPVRRDQSGTVDGRCQRAFRPPWQ